MGRIANERLTSSWAARGQCGPGLAEEPQGTAAQMVESESLQRPGQRPVNQGGAEHLGEDRPEIEGPGRPGRGLCDI